MTARRMSATAQVGSEKNSEFNAAASPRVRRATTMSSTRSSPSGRWVMSRTVRPPDDSRASSTTERAVSGSRCAVGSSRTRTGASERSARAIVRRCLPGRRTACSRPPPRASRARPAGTRPSHKGARGGAPGPARPRSRPAWPEAGWHGWWSQTREPPAPRARMWPGPRPADTERGGGPQASPGPSPDRGSGEGGL